MSLSDLWTAVLWASWLSFTMAGLDYGWTVSSVPNIFNWDKRIWNIIVGLSWTKLTLESLCVRLPQGMQPPLHQTLWQELIIQLWTRSQWHSFISSSFRVAATTAVTAELLRWLMQNLERQGEVRPGVIYTIKLVSSRLCCPSHVAPHAPQCLKASAMRQSAGLWTPMGLARTWVTMPYPSRVAFLTSLLLPHPCNQSVHHPWELLTIHLHKQWH